MKGIKKNILIVSLLCAVTFTTCPITDASVTGQSNRFFRTRNVCYMIPAAIVGTLCAYLMYQFFKESDGDVLARACQNGDLERVQSILENIEDINTVKFDLACEGLIHTMPAVLFACRSGNIEILRWMVDERNANIQRQYEWKLVNKKKHYVFKSNPLCFACERGDNPEMVTYLLENGASIDEKLSITRYETHSESGEVIGSCTPLYIACRRGHLDMIRILLDNEANLESDNLYGGRDGEKPLHAAARAGHSEIVAELLQRGAQIDARNNAGETPFYVAVEADVRRERTLRVLLDNHADINAADNNGNTLLHKPFPMIGKVRFLVENGADVNLRNDDGETPLMIMSKSDFCVKANRNDFLDLYPDIIAYLLSHGADVTLENDEGKTALYFACIEDKPKRAKLLIERGAEIKDEYAGGGIRMRGDKGVKVRIKQLLNEKVEKKKALEEGVKKLLEDQEKDEAKQNVISLCKDKNVPADTKKKMLPQLFEMHKKDILSSDDIEKCLETINFDKDFEKEEKFKEIVAFAKVKKIKDINGKALQ